MRNYKIESYVPEKDFLLGKDARFCRVLFEDCFVVDLHGTPTAIASCRGNEALTFSMAKISSLPHVNRASDGPLILPCPQGTLMVYSVWKTLELALVFLLKESPESVEKAYKNAQRYAFSFTFDTGKDNESTPRIGLEERLCVLNFYMRNLFGEERSTNASAHILMLANLVGCRLHEMSASRVNITLDELELEQLSAYLACAFMTMRRYNGAVSAFAEGDNNLPYRIEGSYTEPEYGIRIEQNRVSKTSKATLFDIPTSAGFASFSNHPAFQKYRIEAVEENIRLHLPLRQKVLLSSFSSHCAQNEIVISLFLLQ